MRTQKRVLQSRVPGNRSKYPYDIVLSVEDAIKIAAYDPDAINKLGTLLINNKVVKKEDLE